MEKLRSTANYTLKQKVGGKKSYDCIIWGYFFITIGLIKIESDLRKKKNPNETFINLILNNCLNR